jgi:hypothetical protein
MGQKGEATAQALALITLLFGAGCTLEDAAPGSTAKRLDGIVQTTKSWLGLSKASPRYVGTMPAVRKEIVGGRTRGQLALDVDAKTPAPDLRLMLEGLLARPDLTRHSHVLAITLWAADDPTHQRLPMGVGWSAMDGRGWEGDRDEHLLVRVIGDPDLAAAAERLIPPAIDR